MSKSPDILAEMLSAYNREAPISYDGKILRFKFPPEQKIALEGELKGYAFKYSFFPNAECEVELNIKYNFDALFFLNEKAFLNFIENYIGEFDHLTIAILDFQGSFIIKYAEEEFSDQKAVLFNTIHYRNCIDFIAESTDFISFHDENERRFLIFSADKGPFFIGYNRNEPRVRSLPDLKPLLTHLESAFSKVDYIPFFKEATIQGTHTTAEEGRFFEMVNSLQVLLDIATRDHNIYLRQFGFDKIKTKFKEERIKYFESIEKNIEAVSKQVTAFPLTFAASIFAGYQVKEKSFILFVILGAYALYTIIAWKILDVVAFNRQKISEDVEQEELSIQNGYQVLYNDFKGDFGKIHGKVNKLKRLILWLRGVLIVLLLGFAAFCVYQYNYVATTAKQPTEVRIVK